MKKNVGLIDRVARVVLGGGLIFWAVTGGPVWAWIGVVPLVTAAIGFCPAYTLLGIKTLCCKGEGDVKDCCHGTQCNRPDDKPQA